MVLKGPNNLIILPLGYFKKHVVQYLLIAKRGLKDFEANQVLKENVFAPGFKTENSSIRKVQKWKYFIVKKEKKERIW